MHSLTPLESAKVKLREIKKFILFATENSKDSKWMPWELGIADGFKTSGNTAIFPAVETANNVGWTEREYLGVYDRIVWGKLQGYEKPVWMVLNQQQNSASTLREWLQM